MTSTIRGSGTSQREWPSTVTLASCHWTPEEFGSMTLPAAATPQPPTPASAAPTAPPATDGNGLSNSPPPAPSRLPRARRLGPAAKLLVAGGLVVLALLVAGGGYLLFAGGHRARADLVT